MDWRPVQGDTTLTQCDLRSEVFKPCVEDKDLAFCLNEGECSIIETVAGVHRHCRCKEGYHGLRCDQFVPKTDAILSDPSTVYFQFCFYISYSIFVLMCKHEGKSKTSGCYIVLSESHH
uniref:EGF-like domain-containing protein n=1 Tax=Echeneis naucrates TaxID=173247 RepID=A0A665W2Q1_ECHNA